MDIPYDYQFVFDGTVDGFSSVMITNTSRFETHHFSISLDNGESRSSQNGHLPSILADCLDLALAVYFADKLSLPKKTRQIKVRIVLPIRCPEIFDSVREKLSDLLKWFTDDIWAFQFERKIRKGRLIEYSPQSAFDYPNYAVPTEAALWSGGVDSLAGLCNRMGGFPDRHFVLIGTGSNSIMSKTQRQVFRSLLCSGRASSRLCFQSIPLRAEYERRLSQNRSHRARGFVFLLIGAVVALLEGIPALHVYENGIGAINLPLPGGAGRDHSRAVHPISLRRMSHFISSVVEKEFRIENPFLFATKAQMCRALQQNLFPAFETISCDQLHRERPIPCGFCSSCILRRHAFAAAGIHDRSRYLLPHGRKPERRHEIFLRYMDQQVKTIEAALQSPDAWFGLSKEYPANLPGITTGGAFDDQALQQNLIRLYRTYVLEWKAALDIVKENLHGNERGQKEVGKWRQMHLIGSTLVN